MTDHRNAETLERLYWDEGLGQREIADRLGVSKYAIYRWMKKHGIPTREDGQTAQPRFQHADQQGYERIRVYEGETRREVYVHRLTAVARYGLDAVADSHVHHENGIGWDNRPENLDVMTASEHATHHNAERFGTGGSDD